jgi:hypothetical protein
MKVFTVKDCHEYYKHNYGPFKPGDRVQTTLDYSGWSDEEKDRFITGTVIGTIIDKGYGCSIKGFDIHEVYEVKFDNGSTIVIWPDEIKPKE